MAVLATLAASVVGGVSVVAPAPAAAKTEVIEAKATGNYSDSEFYPPDPANSEYIAGYYDLFLPGNDREIDVIFRDFFVFDLPVAPEGLTLNSVTMRARNYSVVNDKYPEQIMSIHGVLGSVDDLVNGLSKFADLGQGPSYSSATFDGSEDPDSFSSYTFDAAGVA
ncbi:MAG: hypothetical protein ACKOZW_00180, partial [Cyanobium sp.]